MSKIGVNERVHVSKLQLHGCTHIVEPNYLSEGLDDFYAPFNTTPVIVRNLENEKILKNIAVDHTTSKIPIMFSTSLKLVSGVQPAGPDCSAPYPCATSATGRPASLAARKSSKLSPT